MKTRIILVIGFAILSAISCEELDNNVEEHVNSKTYVSLSDVAVVLSEIPIELSHLSEVHGAVSSSSGNGYDEEYTMDMLFNSPGAGVGEKKEDTRVASNNTLRNLIEAHVRSNALTKSQGGVSDPDRWLNELVSSDIQIYWPYSENWDGETYPIITFDPEDGSEVNIGYEIKVGKDGSRSLKEVLVDEEVAMKTPVWVVNRNTDAGYTTLEMLRKENPEWGEGGGAIRPAVKASYGKKALVLKDFTVKRNYDPWFMGASEFFVKVGSVEDFTASTEAELKLYNPTITDFVIIVKRNMINEKQNFNAVLVSEWTDQMTHCALMITEDDGGTLTEWDCTALVRIASRSYGIELKIPFRSFDDIVWRGRLSGAWLESNSNKTGHFGDIDLTFEMQKY